MVKRFRGEEKKRKRRESGVTTDRQQRDDQGQSPRAQAVSVSGLGTGRTPHCGGSLKPEPTDDERPGHSLALRHPPHFPPLPRSPGWTHFSVLEAGSLKGENPSPEESPSPPRDPEGVSRITTGDRALLSPGSRHALSEAGLPVCVALRGRPCAAQAEEPGVRRPASCPCSRPLLVAPPPATVVLPAQNGTLPMTQCGFCPQSPSKHLSGLAGLQVSPLRRGLRLRTEPFFSFLVLNVKLSHCSDTLN